MVFYIANAIYAKMVLKINYPFQTIFLGTLNDGPSRKALLYCSVINIFWASEDFFGIQTIFLCIILIIIIIIPKQTKKRILGCLFSNFSLFLCALAFQINFFILWMNNFIDESITEMNLQ